MTLELHQVTISPLFSDLSATIGDGQWAYVRGPQGSGKTTLLRAILGLLPVDEGHICLDGELLTPQSAPYFRRQMAYVPQCLEPLYGQDSTTQLAALLDGQSSTTVRWCQLAAGERYLHLLYTARQQCRPLVLIDEPATSLDAHCVAEASRLISEMCAAGSCVLVASCGTSGYTAFNQQLPILL